MNNERLKNNIMTTSVALEEYLYKSVKHYAVENHTTFKKVVEDSLREYLAKYSTLEKED